MLPQFLLIIHRNNIEQLELAEFKWFIETKAAAGYTYLGFGMQ